MKFKKKCPFKEGRCCTYNRNRKNVRGRSSCDYKEPAECPFYQQSHSELKKVSQRA